METQNPCKKCGEIEDFTVYADGAIPDDGYRLIICGTCRNESGWGRTEQEAISIWNRDNPKRGRPSTGFNKTGYMKEYMRKRRAASKAKSLQEE